MNIKKIKPMFTSVLVTKDVYTADEKQSGLIVRSAGEVKEDQTVVAIGDSVRTIKVGDLVHIDPSRYAVKKFSENSVKKDLMENKIVGYNIPQIMVEGKNYLLIEDRDIQYIIEDYEEDTDSGLILPSSGIIAD